MLVGGITVGVGEAVDSGVGVLEATGVGDGVGVSAAVSSVLVGVWVSLSPFGLDLDPMVFRWISVDMFEVKPWHRNCLTYARGLPSLSRESAKV